jgi:ribosomal protein L1
MDTRRFGRKLKLPSTIALKRQLRRLMADDEVTTAETEAKAGTEVEARAESVGIPHRNVGHASMQSKDLLPS